MRAPVDKDEGAMRSSLTVISAILLVAAASPALAVSWNLGDCGSSDPEATQACFSYNPSDSQRSIAQHSAGDDSAIAGHIEAIRLDNKDPNLTQNIRGQDKSELDRIIAVYNTAIKFDPEDDDAYFHRGIANLYAGSLPNALADVGQANKLDPRYAYYALWLDILDKRSNRASRLPQAVSQIDMTKWPAPVIHLLLGETTPADALAAANDPDANKRRGQTCEANFYSGELALHQGTKEVAARLFRLAAADCPHAFVEGPAARAELKALGRSW
jgi:hypothetical protein